MLSPKFFLVACLAVSASIVSAISLREAVKIGNAHFRKQCRLQQAAMSPLIQALKMGDLEKAKMTYTNARPPYEQIETLANVFPEIDRNIDARPYVFGNGEDNAHWQGFHYIERALWRDLEVSPRVVAMAKKLNGQVNKLCVVLKNVTMFKPHQVFAGAEALAYEVPAKKISSEEETWSDLSLMIFRNNYQGIWSQVSPFLRTGKVTKMTKKRIKEQYKKIRDAMNRIDPDHSFATKSGKARPYSSLSTAERAAIIKLAYRFAESVSKVKKQVLAGMDVPEEEEEATEEGETIPNIYRKEVKAGLRYFRRECTKQQNFIKPMYKAILAGDLAAAQKRYAKARAPYEQIEVLAGDFERLDTNIDARPYAYEFGERTKGWRGMHQVERALFRDFDLAVAKKATERVVGDVNNLCMALDEGISGGGSFSAESSFGGMIALSYEVPSKKIASEEETWSDLSLMIFRENLKGIWSQFRPFKSAVGVGKYRDVKSKYMRAKKVLKKLDSGNDFNGGYKFRAYSSLSDAERRLIHEAFMGLARSIVAARQKLVVL